MTAVPITYEMFVHDYAVMRPQSPLRSGQLAWNMLWALRSDLAEGMTDTPMDPFYDDGNLDLFWSYIAERWDSPK